MKVCFRMVVGCKALCLQPSPALPDLMVNARRPAAEPDALRFGYPSDRIIAHADFLRDLAYIWIDLERVHDFCALVR
jgi:hypothetical protein